jgi:hypothetical protein
VAAPHPSDYSSLLHRFLPCVRYDSNEAFFADAIEIMAGANDAFALERASGQILAPAPVAAGTLAADTYAGGQSVEKDDRLTGLRRDYREQAAELHPYPDLRNVVYGHAQTDADGRLWLQFWYFYLYNDASFAGNVGLHEGDWEMVQLRMAGDAPDLAVYAQHSYCEQRAWPEVERAGDAPVVYPARGTHASYFEPGLHKTEVWWDIADGLRRAPPLRLVILDPAPGWLAWPGKWGATKPRFPWDSDSPPGPLHHGEWRNPAALLAKAKDHERHEPPPAPKLWLGRVRGHLALRFDLRATPEGLGAVDRLVVTVNTPDDQSPPRTYTFTVDQTLRGSLLTTRVLDPRCSYDIRTSIVDIDGRASSTAIKQLPALGLFGRLLSGLGSLLYDLQAAQSAVMRRSR